MTDDYWGPMPDDSEYPTPRERLDDGEADRLRALLRRWVVAWMSESAMHGGQNGGNVVSAGRGQTTVRGVFATLAAASWATR